MMTRSYDCGFCSLYDSAPGALIVLSGLVHLLLRYKSVDLDGSLEMVLVKLGKKELRTFREFYLRPDGACQREVSSCR